MSATEYFEKFVKDLEKRTENLKREKTVSESEKTYQEQRRLRVRRYQERWQNKIRYGGTPNGKK
jgi:hypothetical protein